MTAGPGQPGRASSLVLLLAAVMAAWPTAGQAARERGRVRFVTARRAWLDAGRREGLKLGDALELSRGARRAGRCVIDQLADHSASCPADARVGDSVALPAPPPLAPPPPAPPAPAAPLDERGRERLEAPLSKVEFVGGKSALGRGVPLVSASLGHTAFVTAGQGAGFQQTRAELALDGLDLRFGGFRAYAHLTALAYSARPDGTRFRAGDRFQLYVWDLSAASREIGRPFVVAAGRIWPHHAPGLTLVDGVQAGWRSQSGDVEVGAIGGTVPEASTLLPTARWLAGAYYGAVHTARRPWLRLLRHEARLSARDTSQGAQLELEALAQAWVHKAVDVGVQARGTLGAGDWKTPRLEAARASIGVHPDPTFRLYASVRYLDARTFDPDALQAALFGSGRWLHAEGDATWTPRPWVALSLSGGAAQTDGDLGRQYLGGEFGLPRLIKVGGLSVGYREELGWLAGRTAYLALHVTQLERVRVLARASYFEDRTGDGNQLRELGLFAMLDARLVRWLSLRASALGRVQLTPHPYDDSTPPFGLVARGELVGAW